jgi:N-methylhydantoinase A
MRSPEGACSAPIYDRSRLAAGEFFTGPAIVAQLDATTLVPAGWRARVDASGALLLRPLEAGAGGAARR